MIGRKTLVPMLNLGIGAVLGLIALKLTALYFGPVFLGEVAYALAVFGIIYLLTDLAMSEAHVKRVSEGTDIGDCFATFALFRMASLALFVLVAGGSIFIYVSVLGKPLSDTTIPALVFALVYYVAKGIQSIAQSTFEAKLEAARSQIVSFIETFVRVALNVALAFAFAALARGGGPLFGRLDANAPGWRWVLENPGGALAATYAAGAIVGSFVAIYYLRRAFDRGRFRWDILRSYFAFALPLFAVSGVGIFAFFIDRLALGFFGGAQDTGDFEGPRRLVSVLEGIGAAVGLILFPSLSAMIARGERAAAVNLVRRSIRYLSMLTLPAVLFIVVFPAPIIRLTLDAQWLGNSATLSLLALWVFFATIARPHLNLLMGSDRPGTAARIGIAVAVVHIALNLLLVPQDIKSLGIQLGGLGALGAALATILSGALYYLLVVLATHRLTGFKPPLAILRHLIGGLVMVIVLLAIHTWTPFELGRWYTFLVYIPLGALVYGGALVALREITRDDVEYVKNVIHPGELGRYLKSELWSK